LSQDHPIIQVRQGDVLSCPTDLLALKYAQYLYGADHQVAAKLGMTEDRLPREGGHLLVEGRGVAAANALFIGVPPLDRFAYREIREFGRSVPAIAAAVLPEARDICLTLHGPGYGLDESEAFQSELAGLRDAFAEGASPRLLRTVTFVEANPGRAERMRAVLRSSERRRSVGYDAETKAHAFVAMPFTDAFEDVFHYGITPAVHAAGLICERVDQISFTGDVVHRMTERIGAAQVVVADLTGANPNVYLEVGYVWGRGVPTVLVCRQDTTLQFDVRGQRCLFYRSIRDLEERLTREVAALRRAGR
jgi:hypothetical protein